jgi:lambda repressor-like predicted transcriptional regulator
MEPIQIKILIMQRGSSITVLAERWGCRVQELSMCINKHRRYPKLRKKLARFLGKPVKELFGKNAADVRGAA